MDVQQFLAEFGHIANAPGGVARLRELVFSLAFDGKLLGDTEFVEQTHLDKCADFVMGQAPPGNECNARGEGVIFVKTGEFGELYPIVREWTTKPLKLAKQGDVLICVVGATVGKLNLAIDCAIGRSVAAIRPHSRLNTKYLYFMLMPFAMRLRSGSRGSAQGVIGKTELSAIKLRVPTEEEQSRIVAKVDELMALCDQLEAQQTERRKLQNALRQSTLQALASAQSPHELQDSWKRLQANFGCLFRDPEDVKELRLVLMGLAIRGLLTEQLISDGDAAELVFAAPAAAASSTRGRKKSAFLQEEVSESDAPFALPKNWRWARLADIGYFLGGGTPSKSNPDYWRGPIPWISPKDMKVARINSSQDHISEKALSESAAKLIPTGSLLVVVRGMILAHSFPVGLTSREVAINQDMKALCPHRSDMSEFLLLLLAGSKCRFLELVEHSTHGTCRLETDRLTSCVVGIPPLPEQLRIVEIVNQLMLVCDRLQSQLNEMQKCSATLAITSIAKLTGITIEQKEAPVKAPQTELIAPLRLGTPPDVKALAPLATLLARHNGEMSARDLWQRFGGEIDAFYAQLKAEVAHGWIAEPAVAEVREKFSAAVRG